MSDEEYGSSSEEEDEDYVPGEEELSEDEAGVEEIGNDDDSNIKKSKQKKQKGQKRKKKGGIKLDDEDEEEDDEEEDRPLDKEQEEIIKQKDEEKKKSKIEDLWSSFKKDTASARPKTTPQTNAQMKVPSQLTASSSNAQTSKPAANRFTNPVLKKVTITQTFDFAGEEVKVTKTVDADSKEAKQASRQEIQSTDKPQPGPSLGTKRPGGLGSVLGSLGKKQKISTLEKSKLDWDTFKEESGISDELQHHNKDGYLEKQAFLSRTDWKSFEREKAMRNILRKTT